MRTNIHSRLLVSLAMAGALNAVACDENSSDEATGGSGAEGGSSASTGGGDGTGSGGRGNTAEDTFENLPGQIRFGNFVSDGTAGVNLDLYWGATIDDAEFVETIEYGEITDYLTPRQSQKLVRQGLLDADEARYFLVKEDDTESLPNLFLVNTDENFNDTRRLTMMMASAENFSTDALTIVSSPINEELMVASPADEAYVYVWSRAFSQIPDGDFVQVAVDGECELPTEPANANTGEAFVVPENSSGVYLVDANTECASGSEPADGSVDGGKSYLLIGKADTFDVDVRKSLLLELTPGR